MVFTSGTLVSQVYTATRIYALSAYQCNKEVRFEDEAGTHVHKNYREVKISSWHLQASVASISFLTLILKLLKL